MLRNHHPNKTREIVDIDLDTNDFNLGSLEFCPVGFGSRYVGGPSSQHFRKASENMIKNIHQKVIVMIGAHILTVHFPDG